MLTFKTQFPVNEKKTIDDFLECTRVWVSGSPHSKLGNQLNGVRLSDGASFASSNETLHVLSYEEPDKSIAGVRFEKREDDQITWLTDVVGARTSDGFYVAVQLSVDSDLAVERLDQGKRPYIIKCLMQSLGGGRDGALVVRDAPHMLDEGDLTKAADILCGKAGLAMPVVYVSVNESNGTNIDAWQLAKWLSGMAHVVVEPSRSFSFKLMREVYGENVYGGAVGIYWPDGVGKWTFLPGGKYASAGDMQNGVARKVRTSLLSQRTKRECTWSNLQELVSRRRLQELIKSGSNDVEQYIHHFDAELSSKDEEISRLEAELAQARYSPQGAGRALERGDADIPLLCDEPDFYQGERLGLIIDALKAYESACQLNGRKRHLLTNLIERNAQEGERSQILDRLKSVLRQYTSMTSSARAEFEAAGFEIHDDGKHYKLLFRGDSRYPFVLSKTSSDWRGGMNAFSELRKLLF